MTHDDITDDEIKATAALVTTITDSPFFEHELQIRDAGERGLGLVWADDGETWAVVPDPFYTKDFLHTLKAQCNRVRRVRLATTDQLPY